MCWFGETLRNKALRKHCNSLPGKVVVFLALNVSVASPALREENGKLHLVISFPV